MSVIHRRAAWLLPVLGLVSLLCMGFNLALGSAEIPLGEVLEVLGRGPDLSPSGYILWELRLPRALAAGLGGVFLAVSGLLFQVYFRNPIVEPFVLGISSGASLAVALVTLVGIGLGWAAGPYLTTLAALAGALASMALVLAVARRVRQGATLLIIGLMLGYLTHAVTGLLVALAEAHSVKGFSLWSLGSFAGVGWRETAALALLGGLLTLLAFALVKPLNAFLLGEDYAQTMGVAVRRFRFRLVFCACGLAAVVTAAAGPVAFIGLATPHMARLLLGAADHRLLLPTTALLGGAVASLCDLAARLVLSPVESPLSAVTALFGAPVVIGLLLRRGERA